VKSSRICSYRWAVSVQQGGSNDVLLGPREGEESLKMTYHSEAKSVKRSKNSKFKIF